MNETNTELTQSSRKRRIAAFALDHFALTFLIVSLAFLALGPDFVENEPSTRMPLIMLSVILPGMFLYLAKDSFKGISFGKWIMGIMVRDNEDPASIPSFGRLLARNLLVMVWPVEFIALAVNDEKRRFGDRWQKTNVYKNPIKSPLLPRVLSVVGIFLAFFAFTFFFTGKAMKGSEAYKISIQTIEADESVISETGGIVGYGYMPTGGVNISNGVGHANFDITVKGSIKDVVVHTVLEKQSGGQWEMKEYSK